MVYFFDGSSVEFDMVIVVIGYKIVFFFFELGLFDFEDVYCILFYLCMMVFGYFNVFFIGLVQL